MTTETTIPTRDVVAAIRSAYRGSGPCHCHTVAKLGEDELVDHMIKRNVIRREEVYGPGAITLEMLDGDVLYTSVDDVKVKTTTALRRLENIDLHPAVTVLVDHYDDDWATLWWIRMDGQAIVLDAASPEERIALRLLGEKYEQYAAQPPPGPVIKIEITRWRAWP